MFSGITLSRFMCPKTEDERTNMSMTPYASVIGSIMRVCNVLDPTYHMH